MSNPQSLDEDFITEIEIRDYNDEHPLDRDLKQLSNFSVNFTVNHIDRYVILTSKDDDRIISTKNNQPRVVNQSTTIPFDPHNQLTWSHIDFCLQFCLFLDEHVRRRVMLELTYYVAAHPTPAPLVVSINRVEVYEAWLCNEEDEEAAVLTRTRVDDDVEHCCSICLVDLSEGKSACMPCNHAFHDDCIVRWLKVSPTCPVCRFDLVQHSVLV